MRERNGDIKETLRNRCEKLHIREELLWLPEGDERNEETGKDWFLDRKLAPQSGATKGKVNEANYVYEAGVYSSFVFP